MTKHVPALFSFIFLVVSIPSFTQTLYYPSNGYTLEAVRLRSTPSTSGEILQVVPGFIGVEILEQLKSETISNNSDYWYRVRVNDDNQKTGYMFGHFLSVRNAGRKTVTLKFLSVDVEDDYHYFFQNTKTGEVSDYLVEFLDGDLQLLDESGMSINPILANKEFKAIINKIPGLVLVNPEELGPGQIDIIIQLTLIK